MKCHNRSAGILLAAALSLVLAGCGTLVNNSSSGTKSIIPAKSLQLTAHTSIPLTTLAAAAAIVGVVQVVYDPLAPNWEIEEERMGDDTYRLSMKMKRYHTGGAGESIQALKRRASQLKNEQGYADYVLMEYTEGIESETLGARRVAEGTIKLVQRQQADSFMQDTAY